MSNCGICNKKVDRNNSKVNCCDCEGIFHCTCVNVKFTDLEFLKKQGKLWRCANCQKVKKAGILKSSLEHSTHDVSSTDTLELIHSQLADLQNMSKVTNDSINNLSERLTSITKLIETVTKENIYLKQRVAALEERCDKVEQFANRDCLDFVNIPVSANESTKDSVVNFVSQKMNINITTDDIEYCYVKAGRRQVGNNNNNENKQVTVFVRFFRTNTAKSILDAKYKWNKKTDGTVDPSLRHIYINEWLSAEKKSLLSMAKIKQRELKYRFLWVRRGLIMMRAQTGSEVKYIKTMDDLNNLV